MVRWTGDTIAKQERSPEGWGRQIRSYVFGRSAKDIRTGVEQDVERTLAGDLDTFLKSALLWKARGGDKDTATPD